MNATDISNRLKQAGYQYEPESGRYVLSDSDGDDVGTEEIAESLGISVDELLQWEQKQS